MLLSDSHLGSRLHRQPPPDELKVKKQQTEAPKCLHVVTLLLHTVVSTFCFVCAASSAPPPPPPPAPVLMNEIKILQFQVPHRSLTSPTRHTENEVVMMTLISFHYPCT